MSWILCIPTLYYLVHKLLSLVHIVTVKLVEAAGKGVTGCRIARQNLQVRIAVLRRGGSVSWDFKPASGRVLYRTMVAVQKA
jgi:hypothetical protein